MTKTTLKKPPPVQASKAAAALAFGPPTDKEKTTRVNANIRVELHTALKVRAATEGTSIGALIEEWIESWAGKK